MQLEYILFGLLIIVFIYFGIGPGSRLLKKKSHHYIVPPSPENDPDWYPVEHSDYRNFIFIKPSENHVDSQHIENINAQLIGIENIQVEEKGDWFRIEALHSNFGIFHSAIITYNDINGGHVYGYCKHKDTARKDYIFKQSDSIDYLLGVFRSNKNFAIYVDSMHKNKKGNISISSVKELDFMEELKKLPML
ncbi:hypothetical protein [Brumimicrobium oceani]|nr:hypothetical protein [Brumimicrobium oceani]